MRKFQIALCILACLCILAATLAGAFWQNLIAVIAFLLAAVIFGAAMFFVKHLSDTREEQSRKQGRDFMDPTDTDRKDDDR